MQLHFTPGPLLESGEPDLWKIEVTEIDLRVTVRNQSGEPLLLHVENSLETFHFRMDSPSPAGSRAPVWRIVRWDDQLLGALDSNRTEDLSWSRVKHLFL